MSHAASLRPAIDRFQRIALIVGAVGLVLSVLGAWINPKVFFQSYLVAYLFWLGIALGCLGIVMLHHLVGGTWGFVIRRLLEAGARLTWLMLILFVPLVLGMKELYIWTHPDIVRADEALSYKVFYLNIPFFLIRAGIYFLVWLVLAVLLNRWSLKQDQTGEPGLTVKLQRLSGPGLALLFLTASFAAIDWVMSLEPKWYSTIYGAMVITGQALATLAFATLIAAILSGEEPLAAIATPRQFRDLGNLLLAFVMLWAYMSFSQFLIIWCGNLTEEIPWYLRRTRGGWEWIGLALIVVHFFLPFFALLSRELKSSARGLFAVTALILVMQLVTLFWLVAPAFRENVRAVHWIDFVTMAAMSGLWLAAFLWQLKARPLLPLHDPRLEESLAHHVEE